MENQQPLQGIRVVEVCNVAAGPFCGLLLADMGADVVKVENSQAGDAMRSWPPHTDGYSHNFAALNRNKRSITLNLKASADIQLLRRLVAEKDVLLENNRPGVMSRLGVSYEALRPLNPRLVYCSISAYGQSGPRSREAGFDLTLQAMSGIMSVTGAPGQPPVKCGVPIVDFAAGLYAAFSIACALRTVETTGEGMHIDVPMLGAALGIAALQTSGYFGTGRDPLPLGSAHPRNAPYRVFASRDGYFAMAAGTDALWRAACEVIGRLDLADDPRLRTTSLRAQNQDVLLALLQSHFERADSREWLRRFRDAGVPCAPINSYSEALADPQVEHMKWIQPLKLPSGAITRTFTSPIRMSGRPLPPLRRPPELGEHNDEVLGPLLAKSTGASGLLR